MLKEITKEELKPYKQPYTFASICLAETYYKSKYQCNFPENFDVDLKSVFKNNINIQAAFLEHYLLFKMSNVINSSSIIYVNKADLKLLLNLLSHLFEQITIITDNDGKPHVQVSNVNLKYVPLFESLVKDKLLNPYILYFASKNKLVEDIDDKQTIYLSAFLNEDKNKNQRKYPAFYYEYFPNKSYDVVGNTPFINYLKKLYNQEGGIGINVSGCSIDDLNSDNYINSISAVFNKTYLFKYLEPQYRSYYIKILKFF